MEREDRFQFVAIAPSFFSEPSATAMVILFSEK
jgi:hypothetical protein